MSTESNTGTKIDAVTERLKHHKVRAKKLVKLANESYLKKYKVGSFLRYDETANYYFQSSISFKACGKWREAGDSLVQCAKMHIITGLTLEAATLFSLASDVYLKVDKTEAIKATRSSISLYCEIGKFDIAGRLERNVANTHFINKHWEEAAIHFKKAANFLSGEQLLDQSDVCLERAAQCFVELRDYEGARKLFELVAEGCVNSNLRRFNAREYLLKAALCMLSKAIPPKLLSNGKEDISEPKDGNEKYGEIIVQIDEYEKIDYMWRCSKEQLFLRNIIKARLAWDRHTFADHLYWWNNIHPLDRPAIELLENVLHELQEETDRKLELRRRELKAREKAERRKKKLEIQKKLMDEMGMQGEAKIPDEEDEDEDEEGGNYGEEGGHDGDGGEGNGSATLEEKLFGDDDDEEFVIPEYDDVPKPEPRKRRENKGGGGKKKK